MSSSVQNGAVYKTVQDFYGKLVRQTGELPTASCLAPHLPTPKHMAEAFASIHEEVKEKYCGCGRVIPECIYGATVLDMGCGSGKDSYAISKLVGENGHVTGVDMTSEQIEVAKKYIDYHTEKFGYKKPNVTFMKGYMEKLGDIGLKDETFDIIVSNCVLNLSPDKKAFLKEAYRLLKEGGELYISDIFCDRELPQSVRKDDILWDVCLGGDLWWEQLYDFAEEIGYMTPRLVCAGIIGVAKEELKDQLGDAKFLSVTYRLFKLPAEVEQWPSKVIYDGGIMGFEHGFLFDHNNIFEEGKTTLVDSQLGAILKHSRFGYHFFIKKDTSNAQHEKVDKFNPFNIAEKPGKIGACPGC